jgi:hypothetical protein
VQGGEDVGLPPEAVRALGGAGHLDDAAASAGAASHDSDHDRRVGDGDRLGEPVPAARVRGRYQRRGERGDATGPGPAIPPGAAQRRTEAATGQRRYRGQDVRPGAGAGRTVAVHSGKTLRSGRACTRTANVVTATQFVLLRRSDQAGPIKRSAG